MRIRSKFKEYGWIGDWRDWFLLVMDFVPEIIGIILVWLGFIWIGCILFGIGVGFYIGSLTMRQFMLRWIEKTGMAKVEGEKGKEIVTFLREKERDDEVA